MKYTAIIGELSAHTRLLNRLEQAMAEGDFSLVVIFPTISLLRTIETELLNRPDVNGIGGFRLLLFEGFIGELRERLGLNGRLPTNIERDLVITQVFQELNAEKKLTYLNRIPFTLNYRQAILDGIAEWKRSSLTPELFMEWSMDRGEKERELALIYSAYQQRMLDYGFTEDDLTLAELQLLRMNGLPLPSSKVILYGFTDLTPLQTDFIKALEPWFEFEALVDPTVVPEFVTFTKRYFPFKTMSKNENQQFNRTTLAILQKHLWTGAPGPLPIISGDSSVQLIQAAGHRQAVGIARAICGLLRSGHNYDWDDFLILAPNPQQFIQMAAPVFEEYQLKLLGVEKPVRESLPVNQYLLTLKAILGDWQWPELKVLVHHYYQGKLAQEGDRLLIILAENYGALSGKARWLKLLENTAFHRQLAEQGVPLEPLQQLCDELQFFPDEDCYQGYLLQAKRWFEKHHGLNLNYSGPDDPAFNKEILNYKSARHMVEAISAVLEMDQKLTGLKQRVTLSGFKDFFEEHLLGDSLKERYQPGMGIRVISPREVRGLKTRVVFITGLEQGNFPRVYVNDWKLDPSARFDLKTLGIELETGDNYQIQEKFSFYWGVQAATEHLFLVYQDQDADGQLANPSPFLNDLLTYLPQLAGEIQIYHLEPEVCRKFDDCYSDFETRQLWVVYSLSAPEGISLNELAKYQQLYHNPQFQQLAAGLEYWLKYRRFGSRHFSGLGGKLRDLSDAYFRAEAGISITALEDYLICPYRFFLKHLLKIRPLPEASLLPEALELGNLYHQILAGFLNHYLGEALTWDKLKDYQQHLFALSEAKLIEWKEAAANDLVRVILAAAEEEIHRTLQRWLMAELKWSELTGYRFRPYLTEFAFGQSSLSNNSEKTAPGFVVEDGPIKIMISGRVDRLDTDAEGRFIVYDYKLGRGPSANDLKDLKKIQIPLYLLALEQILFGQDKALGGAYLGLKGPSRANGGIWHGERLAIPWRSKSSLSAVEWEEWLESVSARLVKAVRGIRSVQFPLTTDKCPDYCEYSSCCRRQEREVEMSGSCFE